MISINILNLQFGKKHIFKDVSAMINDQARIGLVGVNGAGKSTLLKIIGGGAETDPGVIAKSKHATTGYLPQEISSFTMNRTLLQEVETAFANILAMQEELKRINHQLSTTDPTSPGFSDLLHQQGELQHLLDQSDFFLMKSQIEKVLTGLGFSENDFNRNCREFSGGWAMRIMLAKLLLARPAFLFLDEPTNHLDIESLTWIEDYLHSYKGAFVIVSHDRTFLDNLTTSIWEMSLGNLTIYKGNYTQYLKDKELRLEVQRAAYENQQAQIQQTMRFVERFRAKSTKARQVQSRVKQLSKMERIEIEETDTSIRFSFPPATPCGRQTLAVKNLRKSFDGKAVFSDISFELQRGDKMAVVGVNGAGKSTLVRLLAGLESVDSGTITPGHNVSLSYFGQHQAQELPQGLTVLQTIQYVEGDRSLTSDRSLLGAFLFKGDDVDKKVSVLSGGEKSRLALAKMIVQPANLLIMDEPTNHLDMSSQEILQNAMQQYDGTIIVVSHNRYFVDRFVNKVLEIKNGKATVYNGNITYYLEKIKHIEQIAPAPVEESNDQPDQHAAKAVGRGKEARKAQALLRQKKTNSIAPFKKQLTATESQIEKLEKQKEISEGELADPELYKNDTLAIEKNRDYRKICDMLDEAYALWETTQAKIDELENRYRSD